MRKTFPAGRSALLTLILVAIVVAVQLPLAFTSTARAESTPQIEWTRQFGTSSIDYAYAVSVDSSGVYVAGYAGSALPGQTSSGGSDAFVRKLSTTDGSEVWTSQFGTSSDDLAYAVSVDSSGVYVAGYTYGTLPGQTSSGGWDAFVRKYDPSGNVLWTRQFGSSASDGAFGISVDSSGVYVAGYTRGTLPDQTSSGGSDAFVRKLSTTDGSEVWTSQFGTSSDDLAYAVSVDSSGVYVAGDTSGTFPGQTSAGNYDAFVRRLSTTDGSEVWTRQFGTGSFDRARGVSVDSSGVYVAGYTDGTLPDQTSSGGRDAFVRKLSTTDGSEVWTRQFGTSSGDQASRICVDSSGVYVAGDTGGTLPDQTSSGDSDAFVRKYDPSGNVLWTRQFGSSAFDGAFVVSADSSGIYVAGYTTGTFPGQTNSGGTDAFVVKFSPNNPPTAEADGPYSVDEGSCIAITASGSDPDGDPLTFAWDLDNDGTFETPGQSVTFSAASLDGPSSHTVTVQVTDSGGLSTIAQTTVNVLNVAPTVGPISAPTDPVAVGTSVMASANFTDPGVLDTHTALWDWGDGNVDETSGSGSVTGSHAYTATGVYTLTLTVTDNDGASGQSAFQYVVVYDPGAGFVTGGGWIDSPEGAYTPDPSLTGKANFGFVSKYKKGEDTPSGETQFQLSVTDLNFHSTSYQWLVIAGAKAQFKGSGTINGSGDYGFMLTAIDGQINGGGGIDKFRIKIWDKETDQVIYDNQIGDATQAIGGGSIVIHSK